MSALPEPFTPPHCDLRDIDGFILNVERLLASELWAISTGDEFKAAMALWARAWKQVPAASLPNDDRVLAAFSGAGAKWRKVKARALHGFVLCADGRLYHRTLADAALAALERKTAFRDKRNKDAERLRKWREQREGNATETHFNAATSQTETRDVAEIREGKGKGKGEEERKKGRKEDAGAEAPPSRPPPVNAVRQALGTVLDAEHVEAVIEHRRALRKPVTLKAAELLASKFARARDGPNAAADAMIANGWVGFEPSWMENRNGNGSAANSRKNVSPPRVVEFVRELRNSAAGSDGAGTDAVPDQPRIEAGGR